MYSATRSSSDAASAICSSEIIGVGSPQHAVKVPSQRDRYAGGAESARLQLQSQLLPAPCNAASRSAGRPARALRIRDRHLAAGRPAEEVPDFFANASIEIVGFDQPGPVVAAPRSDDVEAVREVVDDRQYRVVHAEIGLGQVDHPGGVAAAQHPGRVFLDRYLSGRRKRVPGAGYGVPRSDGLVVAPVFLLAGPVPADRGVAEAALEAVVDQPSARSADRE